MEFTQKSTKGTVLVTGGAGYIGSITALTLRQEGYSVVVLDRLDYQQPIPLYATFEHGDCGDPEVLDRIFRKYSIQAVVHCAGFIEVGLSVIDPARFYLNNIAVTHMLLSAMRVYGVNTLIFSSSCAVYGDPITLPMAEYHQRNPVNPYGRTKLAIEFMLQDYALAYGLRFVGLRYFNAAGAWPEFGLGECHEPETHVIPRMLCAIKNKTPFKVFGNTYPTHDGTCVRDYVHVVDIAQAHVQALEYLETGAPSDFFNLGTGTGYSVLELVNAVQDVCKQTLSVESHPARLGDAPVLLADAFKAHEILRWKPVRSDLHTIIADAWEFENSHNTVKELKHGVAHI